MTAVVSASDDFQPADELASLIESLVEDRITVTEHDRLGHLLADDSAEQERFLDHLRLHAALHWDATELFSHKGQPAPASPQLAPGPGFLCNTANDPIGYSSSGWPVAYLSATVILGLGLLVGALLPVSPPAQVVRELPPVTKGPILPERGMEFVGRITGMIDCRWADPNTAVPGPVAVPLGRKYALASGLMEITYSSGTKVILQGPATYEVESKDGGYLSFGKLTARVEKKEEGRTKNEELSASRSSFLIPHSYFAVRTPTATVTDLGTEFGVEVSEQGQTTSHVFRGSVKLQLAGAASETEGNTIVLRENESVQTEKGNTADGPAITICRLRASPAAFARQMIKPPKLIDLLDIVAGGNGLGHRRERGIDPSTVMEDPLFMPGVRQVDRGYHRASTYQQNLIDGVFLTDGSQGAVQLDSAGHTFVGFPKAPDGVWGSLWSRAATIKPADIERAKNQHRLVYCIDRDEQFTPAGRGLLCFPGTMGITFNIEAMRKAYPSVRPARFRSVAGTGNVSDANMPEESCGDLWVFVDGQLKLKRMRIGTRDGVVQVNIELGPDDHFLTLVCTDSAEARSCGFVIFGDPVLELVPVEEGRL